MKNPLPRLELIEFKTMAHKNKNTRPATPYYLTARQKTDLLDLGDACYIVFSHYLDKASVEGYDFDDGRVAAALHYDIQKVKRTRILLKKNGWFIQSTFTNKKGQKVRITYLGQIAVRNYLMRAEMTKHLKQNQELFN